MKEFEAYKQGIIDCLSLLESKESSAEALADFMEGVKNLEKPAAFTNECTWVESVLEEYIETGKVCVDDLSIPESISSVTEGLPVLESPSDVIFFVNSIVPSYEDGSMDDFDFFQYCSSVVDQFKYVGNKKVTPKIIGKTREVIEGLLFDEEENRYQDEFRWLKAICTNFIDDGKVFINEDDIPLGIEVCNSVGRTLTTTAEMVDFIEAIRVTDSDYSVESYRSLSEEED